MDVILYIKLKGHCLCVRVIVIYKSVNGPCVCVMEDLLYKMQKGHFFVMKFVVYKKLIEPCVFPWRL